MSDLNDPLVRALLVGALISLPFKILGLWRSARNDQKGWFAAMLIFNTVGIVELVYLFYFSTPKKIKSSSTSDESKV